MSGIKIIVWVVVVVVVIGGGWGLWNSGAFKGLMPAPASTADQTGTVVNAPAANPSGLPTGQNDTTDAAMAQDVAAVDAQLAGVAQDSANVKNSASDKPLN